MFFCRRILVPFCFLYCCSLYFSDTESNAIINPCGSLKWKMRLVKNIRLSPPLTEVMKTVRLTSPLPDVLCLSSPRPRLRYGRRLALLSRPNPTLNTCALSFILSLALLSRLPLLLTSPIVLLPGNRLQSSPITSDPTFLSPAKDPA